MLDYCKRVVDEQMADLDTFVRSAHSLLGDDPPAGSYAAHVNEYARGIEPEEERDAALFVLLQTRRN